MKAKAFILQKHIEVVLECPKGSDFRLVEEELPPLKDGEFLAEAVYLSVGPYRPFYSPLPLLGKTFSGSQVAKIIESKSSQFSVGEYVLGVKFGWRTHTISDGKPSPEGFQTPTVWKLPTDEGFPLSMALGVLGMPGVHAYYGLLEICEAQPGETVVVSEAAGAAGHIAGQIAKIKGCKVIGLAGSDEKGEWLTEELKFDHFINYTDKNFKEKFDKAAPNGVDCYLDNVGGAFGTQIMKNMIMSRCRVADCAYIPYYGQPKQGKPVQPAMRISPFIRAGFMVIRGSDKWLEAIQQNKKWLKEGKLKYRESVTEGFENTFSAFIDVLEGENFGNSIIKV